MPIEDPRDTIAKVDGDILELLKRRVAAARALADSDGEAFDSAWRSERLRAVAREAGDLPADGIRATFTEIDSMCANLVEPLRIGFFGPEATYTHMAALEYFGSSVDCKPFRTIEDVFGACEKGAIDFGVVPIENSSAGVVHQTLDQFADSQLLISGEVTLAIHHVLMATCDLRAVDRVYSHYQPVLQCRAWLKEHLPSVEMIETDSTSEAARRAAQETNAAAIASELAARVHGLKVLERGIEDVSDNITRFWVIGRESARPSERDKTSIMFSVKDKPGALYNLLLPFHRDAINLTKIESRPTRRRAWEYLFFVDLEGHASEERIANVLGEIEEHCEFMRVMGSYPRNDQPREELKYAT
jgi:chorismate mutase / prephenate dehydratase